MLKPKRNWTVYGEDTIDEQEKKTIAEMDAGLPDLPFLLHIDQVMTLTSLTENEFKRIAHRRGVDYGEAPAKKLALINISPNIDEPMWRIDYKEFRRWCRRNNIPTYQW